MLADHLPQALKSLLPDSVVSYEVQEKTANCSDCYMVGEKKYSSLTKCCTFQPYIANFNVGHLLLNSAIFKEHFKQSCLQRKNILPLGWIADHSYQKQFLNKQPNEFGQNAELLCPFYNAGSCDAWSGRGSQCIAFHCVSDYGKSGEEFWTTLYEVLYKVECEVSQLYLLERGFLWPEIEKQVKYLGWQSGDPANASLDWQQWSSFWLHHQDDIYKFFIDSYEFSQNLAKIEKQKVWASINELDRLQQLYQELKSHASRSSK